MPESQTDASAADDVLCAGDAVDIETALNQVGVGPFQWMALVVCGLANAADAVEILGMSLVLPAAEGDSSFELTPAGKSALSSCIFLGMLLGGLLWGPMGDVLGRRRSLLVALLINAFFGMMSAGARSVGALVAMRLLGGVGVGGSVPVVFSFLAELLPAKSRGRYMVGLAAHWMVGSIFSAGMGWAIIPTAPDAWRVFLAVASAPAWCAAVGAWFMPESPRFLLVQGDTEGAEQVLQRMSAINWGAPGRRIKLIPHKSHHLLQPTAHRHSAQTASHSSSDQGPQIAWQHAHGHHSQQQSNVSVDRSNASVYRVRGGSSSGGNFSQTELQSEAAAGVSQCGGSGAGQPSGVSLQQLRQQQRRCCKSSFTAAKLLFQQPLRRRFLPLLVAWLGLCGGWYSTVLWIPEFFKARGAHSASLYAETFAVAAANLPGNIASIFMVDWLGRRLTACICLAGACVAALLFAFAPADPFWSVTAACIFNGISVGGWNALDLLSAELFATEVRSTAMGLLGAFGRLASFTTTFMAGALMQRLLWSPLLVAAALLAAGSVAIMLLPEMAHKPLEDTIEDAEDSEVIMTALVCSSGSSSLPQHRAGGGSRSGQLTLPGDQAGDELAFQTRHSSGGGGRADPLQHQQPQVEMATVANTVPSPDVYRGRAHAGAAGSSHAGFDRSREEEVQVEERLGLLKATAQL